MTKVLAISIRFLSDRYHGRVENGRSAEWPPSPLRVFQAMLAGAAPRWSDADIRDTEAPAFRWLERQGPPMIYAPPAHAGRVLLTYVRENLSDVAPDKRDAKFHRPTLIEGDPKLMYIWPVTDSSDERGFAKTIAQCAKHIRALGWGIDMAVGGGDLIDDLKVDDSLAVRWTPCRDKYGRQLRISIEGTLDDLLRRYAASLNRIDPEGRNPVPPISAYSVIGYRHTTELTSRPFAAFALRPVIDPAIAEQDTPDGAAERRKGDRSQAFRIDYVAKVAAMLRHTACEASKKHWPFDRENSARYVAGHGDRTKRRSAEDLSPRFSYIPLPSIGSLHADGLIRRMIIAEPFGGDGSHAAWAAQRLAGLGLIDQDTGKAVATLERLGVGDRGEKVLPFFVGASREWTTATPMVLPGYDDLDVKKAAALFSRACDQAGLPPGCVESFEFIGPPRWGAGKCFVPTYLRGWPLRHVRVLFRESVRGPIALGAGRHCGLGVLAVESFL